MKRTLSNFSRRYETALRAYLKRKRRTVSQSWAGLPKWGLAKLHEQVLVTKVLPGSSASRRRALARRAGAFFAQALGPPGKHKLIEILSRRTVDLAASNVDLRQEIIRGKGAEKVFKKNERHYLQLLEQSDRLQEQLRRLSRKVLSAQEDERKQISRELHDVIAQTLTGINVRLATLKKEAAINAKGLGRNIASTQRLVEKSVNIVHRFARELRPTVLDDIGLVPALDSFIKNFTARTGVRARLTSFAGLEKLDANRRTVLFRVAQEALTNVARHARAHKVEINIRKLPHSICMQITDDGKSFQVQRVLLARRGKRLGLLGMRERLEMVNGRFEVDSTPGRGTTITASIPFGPAAAKKRKSR